MNNFFNRLKVLQLILRNNALAAKHLLSKLKDFAKTEYGFAL
jgi:hypothetical protein